MDRMPGTRWIVVGLDGFDHDREVLTAALRQAAQSESHLCVVRALGISESPPGATFEAAVRLGAAALNTRATTVRRQLRCEVERLAADVAPAIGISYQVERGDPATTLLAAAAVDEADMIVVGTHSDSGGLPLLLGTVSQDVAVHAHCPVLLVPRSDRV
jgi:nucleotide-binding universal stress UspA family protein